eukprot:182218_1
MSAVETIDIANTQQYNAKQVVEDYIKGRCSNEDVIEYYKANPNVLIQSFHDYIIQHIQTINDSQMDLLTCGYMHGFIKSIPHEIIKVCLLFYGSGEWISTRSLIILHYKIAQFFESINQRNPESIQSAFTKAVASNEYYSKTLSVYIHYMSKDKHVHELFGTDLNENDITNSVIALVPYIYATNDTNNDVFFEYFHEYLSHRLINNLSESLLSENIVINTLDFMGCTGIFRLKEMINDIRRSKDIDFKNVSDISFSLNVIFGKCGIWPSTIYNNNKPYNIVKPICDIITDKYISRLSGRRVHFHMNKGKADLSVQFNAKTKNVLVVSTLQMCVLLLFNYRVTLTFGDILCWLKPISKDIDEIIDAILSLVHPKVKVMRKAPNTKSLELDHKLQINPKFKNRRAKISVPTLMFTDLKNKQYCYNTNAASIKDSTEMVGTKQRVKILKWDAFCTWTWSYNVC